MREIKFRAWDKNKGKMFSAEEVRDSKGDLLAVGLHGLPIVIDRDSFRDDEIIGWNIDHYITLMQFTGLVDKHGKEIYEGDIIQRVNIKVPLLVRWNQKEARFDVAKDPDNFNATVIWYTQLIEEEYEVIGNIYENPELMRGGKV
jgi:hypothetical protein